MFKKNLVIGVGGVISVIVLFVVAGVLILALTGSPGTTAGETTAPQTKTSH